MRLTAAVVTALALLPIGSAMAANTPVITDPYTNGSSQHATAVEPDTFAFGSTLVVAAQVGRFFDGGASGTAFATSRDGGASFTSGALPGLTNQPPAPSGGGGPFVRTTDPVVAYDSLHNVWMISSLGLDANVTGAAIVVNRSTDGGMTWPSVRTVAAAGPGNDYDKNWVTCDNQPLSPFKGHCYHTWDDFGDGDRILMSTSTDGGLTWSPPIQTASGVFGLGGQPVVQPDGDVIVPAANAFETAIIAFRSTDGGASWGDEVVVSRVRSRPPGGNLRAGPLPTAEVGANGRVYTVWQDCRFQKGCKSNDLVLSTSDDGVTWSSVQRIPTGGGDHFIPGIGVKPGTPDQLALTYYSYANPACGSKKAPPCALQADYVQSNDGGANWSSAATLAGPFPVTWTPDTSQGRMVGDYISTSWIGTKAFGAFAVANAPTGTVFDQKIYVPAGGVTATAFPNPTVAAQSFSDNGAQNANPRSVIRPARR
jgi:BNR repeat-like domain